MLSDLIENECSNDIEESSKVISNSLRNGGTVFFCGNGGSASIAKTFPLNWLVNFKMKGKLLEQLL